MSVVLQIWGTDLSYSVLFWICMRSPGMILRHSESILQKGQKKGGETQGRVTGECSASPADSEKITNPTMQR